MGLIREQILIGTRKGIEIMQSSEARKRFVDVMIKHGTRTTANFEAVMSLARVLSQAEDIGFKLDPDSVERALKSVLGVD